MRAGSFNIIATSVGTSESLFSLNHVQSSYISSYGITSYIGTIYSIAQTDTLCLLLTAIGYNYWQLAIVRSQTGIDSKILYELNPSVLHLFQHSILFHPFRFHQYLQSIMLSTLHRMVLPHKIKYEFIIHLEDL